MGSEWATGTAMTAELWPDKDRGKGAGLMQCGLGIGFFLASLAWLFMSPLGQDAWRYMFLLGILPGLATLWMRRGIPESTRWEQVRDDRNAARRRKQSGATLGEHEQALTRFTLTDLFKVPEIRRRTILVLLMSLSTTLGWWGISTWVPPYIGSVAAHAGLPAATWASYAGMSYNVGAIAGYIGLGFFADKYGRKPITIVFFALPLVLTPLLFLWTHDLYALLLVAAATGYFSLGQYTWMPTWLPELYPTRMRASAIGFAFNVPRFLAWMGPLLSGSLIAHFGGYGQAAVTISMIYFIGVLLAPFLPETVGKPLPEEV
jgi:MFS family permease